MNELINWLIIIIIRGYNMECGSGGTCALVMSKNPTFFEKYLCHFFNLVLCNGLGSGSVYSPKWSDEARIGKLMFVRRVYVTRTGLQYSCTFPHLLLAPFCVGAILSFCR